jgi:hypothetical protein
VIKLELSELNDKGELIGIDKKRRVVVVKLSEYARLTLGDVREIIREYEHSKAVRGAKTRRKNQGERIERERCLGYERSPEGVRDLDRAYFPAFLVMLEPN